MESNRRTVLVLGAGASAPYGFPVGQAVVRRAMMIDTPTERFLRWAGAGIEHINAFACAVRTASPPSIDYFLENRPEFAQVGKLLIANCLVPEETVQGLVAHEERRLWHHYLLDTIGWNAVRDALLVEALSVITFNYDRSFEAALACKIAAYTGKELRDVMTFVSRLPVVHVYGSLGTLDHNDQYYRPYGGDHDAASIALAAQGISIVRDGSYSTSLEKAQEYLRRASEVVFLGHGYLPANVQRLRLNDCCADRYSRPDGEVLRELRVPNCAQLYGTAFGRTPSECTTLIAPQFQRVGGITLGDSTEDVLGFLRNHTELVRPWRE